MKNTKFKILISSIAVFSGLILAPFAFAQPAPANPIVQFERDPLFQEANFMPAEGVTRWIKVINNSGSQQKIAIETVNESDSDNFASKLELIIKENGTELYSGTLRNLFDAGKTPLSNLSNGANTQYDLTITFDPSSGNEYQGEILGFDISIGFKGIEESFTEGSSFASISGGGGGASYAPDASEELSIFNLRPVILATDSVIVIWQTNKPADSRVVYSADPSLHNFNFSDSPNFGYADSSPLDSAKVLLHSITISGLLLNTTYHLRGVSTAEGEEAVSTEFSFVTAGVAGDFTENLDSDEEGGGGIITGGPNQFVEEGGSEGQSPLDANKPSFSNWLASIGTFANNILILLALPLLAILWYLIYWFRKKR
jgi:hypothetical protein